MEIVLVRHASTSWSGRRYCGRSDPPLNRAGIEEAADLGRRLGPTLAARTWIVASPSRRSMATARAIAAAAGGLRIERDARWLETDFGIAEGLRFDALERVAPDIASAVLAGSTSIDWPGGETASALEARVAAAWSELLAAERDAVVVTHAGPLMHALAFALDRPVDLGRGPAPGTATRMTIAAAGPSRRLVLPSGT
jgi:broad specificity phosphatase PhoE